MKRFSIVVLAMVVIAAALTACVGAPRVPEFRAPSAPVSVQPTVLVPTLAAAAPESKSFRIIINVVEVPEKGNPLATREGMQSRDRGRLIREGVESGTILPWQPDPKPFAVKFLQGAKALAGNDLKVNGAPAKLDGSDLEVPIRLVTHSLRGKQVSWSWGEIEIPGNLLPLPQDFQAEIVAPLGIRVLYPENKTLWSATQADWKRRTGEDMSELAFSANRGCGGSGCPYMMFHFVFAKP